MKVKTISATRAVKVNLGDYETTYVEAKMEAELDAGENADEALSKLHSRLTASLRGQVKELGEDGLRIAKRFGLKKPSRTT